MAKKTQIKKIIDVKNLVKRYKSSTENAIDGISFYVEEGAFFSLLGPNGAGKTTTISILTTILSKTSGVATLNDMDIETQAAKVRKQIGVIFQNPSLDRNLTAEENIRFHSNLYGLYPYRLTFNIMPKTYQDKVLRLAKLLELEKEIHLPVKSLSGGMKRKLEIIRSLMHNPKVLFLDEPTTGLDPISRANLWKYLQQVRKEEKTTVFLTTHYLEEAETADYICIINKGKIVSQGTPDEIKEALIERCIEVDAKKRDELKKELNINKLNYSGNGSYKICLEKNDSAQKIIQQIKSPLSVLRIKNPTLEQAYVNIISKSNSI